MGPGPVQWGMIGCGDVTERKSAPAFSKIPGSKLMAVGSRTPEKARDYALRHAVPVWHPDPFAVIHDPGVDIIYIATPPGSHAEYALEAIGAGKPVYIEKPMARNFEECRVINSAAEKAGIPVYVAYYRRSLDYFKKVKEIVDSGRIGRIRHITVQQLFPPRTEDYDRTRPPWRVIPEISGGGYFHDMGCHALDILFYIFGDPVSAEGAAANEGGLYVADDTVEARLILPGGVQISGNWSFVAEGPGATDTIEAEGEKGTLRFSVFSFDPIILAGPGGEEHFNAPSPEHIQMPLIGTIVDELNGKGSCPSTGMTGAVTSRVMDQITGKWKRI